MKSQVIAEAEKLVKSKYLEERTGHDWYHMNRVRNMALFLCEKEQLGDCFLVELMALLHDMRDTKLIKDQADLDFLKDWLIAQGLTEADTYQLIQDIDSISYSKGKHSHLSIEAAIVQDADRLDAIGAIGIARAFTYGSSISQMMYLPENEANIINESSAIQHFYDKLLLLKDSMNTNAAKELAEERHQFMLTFLQQFMKEWNQ